MQSLLSLHEGGRGRFDQDEEGNVTLKQSALRPALKVKEGAASQRMQETQLEMPEKTRK